MLYGVTLARGKADDGGGMYNAYVSPRLTQAFFSSNQTQQGGGMYNEQSAPEAIQTVFVHNTASAAGGGAYNEESAPLFSQSVFSANQAGDGGGLYNRLSASASRWWTIAPARQGGGMVSDGDGVAPTVINSIFWHNTAAGALQQIFFLNDGASEEKMTLYAAIVQGGLGNLSSGRPSLSLSGGGTASASGATASITVFFVEVRAFGGAGRELVAMREQPWRQGVRLSTRGSM